MFLKCYTFDMCSINRKSSLDIPNIIHSSGFPIFYE